MGKLTADMKRVVLEQKLGFVATVSPDGTANLSPKGTTTVWDDDHLLFADIRSPNTVRNLKRNPSVEVNVVDVFSRRGYRFKGRGVVFENGSAFEEGVRILDEAGFTISPERIRSIVRIRVEQASELLSPAYDTGGQEAELRERWTSYYTGLRPPHLAPATQAGRRPTSARA
jgi:uncharacterized protein